MAIAFDASSSWENFPASWPLTISHTVTGTNTLLLVWVAIFNTTVTSVTYNWVAMTQLATKLAWSAVNVYIFWLLSPTTWTNNIVINYTWNTYVRSSNASYTWVKQSWLPDATGTNSGTTETSIPCSVTSVADNSWMAMFWYASWWINTTVTNWVLRTRSPSLDWAIWDSNTAITPAWSYTITWWRTWWSEWWITWVTFAPFVATPNSSFFNFL